MITNIINAKKDTFFEINNRISNSIYWDPSGKPHSDTKLKEEKKSFQIEMYNSINKILGESRCRQFQITLMMEAERQNSKRLNDYLETRKSK